MTTSPFDRRLPPLTDLPPPPRIPGENSSLVPPGEIIAESKQQITRRLLAISWVPALIIVGLWYSLLILFVLGTSPTMWSISLLAGLAEPAVLRSTLTDLGFDSDLLGVSFILLPALATCLSIALLPVATRAIAGMSPRRFLSEQGFQRAVATRLTAVVMIPPIATVVAVPVLVALQAPLPWSGMGTGPLLGTSLAVGAIMIAWVSIRAWVTAPRVLGIQPWDELRTTARLDRDLDRRRAAAKQVLAQDRRHLPPGRGTPEATGALTPRGVATALARISRASLLWLGPALVGIAWIVFSVADIAIVLTGVMSFDLAEVPSALRWPVVAIGVPVLLLVLLAIALSPGIATVAARGLRREVRDQRTYEDWAHRARVNPWEQRVVTLTGVFAGVAVAAGTVVFALALSLVGAASGLSWTWVVIDLLVVAPLLGGAAASAMRTGLRDVIYGPAGWYMRRETPYALVAPDIGTRAEVAKDPAVRAEMRRRLQEQAGDHSLELFDLDAAGERLWVDDSLPGATETRVRGSDIAAGRLPDFGAGASPLTSGSGAGTIIGAEGAGGPAGSDGPGPADRTGGAEAGRTGDDIPDSITGLRER